MQELESKSRMLEDVVAALRNEEAAKLAAQHDVQAARSRIHQLEVCTTFPCVKGFWEFVCAEQDRLVAATLTLYNWKGS